MNAVLTIKALEDGVTVLFTSRDSDNTPPSERLDKGEVLIIPAPEQGDGIRVRGCAEIYTPHHVLNSESGLVIGARTENAIPPAI